MDFETAKEWIENGERVYSDTNKPKEGYLGSICFGTKLDPGVFYDLMRKGVLSLHMIVDGIGEFGQRPKKYREKEE